MDKLALCLLMISMMAILGCAQTDRNEETLASMQVISESVNISSGNMTFPAYLAAPAAEGKWPGIVMIHFFRGLEPGYETLADQFAKEGYVVIAPQWQPLTKLLAMKR
jgi:carboxymethylenebutenolidase